MTTDTNQPKFLLVKQCPDGKILKLDMPDENYLREHLTAMWANTPGYHVVAVVSLPGGVE